MFHHKSFKYFICVFCIISLLFVFSFSCFSASPEIAFSDYELRVNNVEYPLTLSTYPPSSANYGDPYMISENISFHNNDLLSS